MSSIYYINLNQDGGAGGDMYETRKRMLEPTPEQKEQFKKYEAKVTKIQAMNRGRKERSCIRDLDYFINHKEECRKVSSNFATRNHLVLGKPQKMINKDGRKWIVYNAKIEDSFQTVTKKQVDTSKLFEVEVDEGQIGGLRGIIPIRLIKEKGTNGIYFVDPEKYQIDRNDEDIQQVVAMLAQQCVNCLNLTNKQDWDKFKCDACGKNEFVLKQFNATKKEWMDMKIDTLFPKRKQVKGQRSKEFMGIDSPRREVNRKLKEAGDITDIRDQQLHRDRSQAI